MHGCLHSSAHSRIYYIIITSSLKVLVKADIKLDAKNEFNKTPIHMAAEQGHVP